MSTTTAPKTSGSRRSCFFYGCLTLVVLSVITAVGLFFGARYALKKINEFIVQYTDTQPMPLPKVEMSDSDYAALEKRVTAFEKALEGQGEASPLVLTGDDINALIARDPDFAAWKDKIYLTIKGDELQAQVSIPLDEMANMPGFGALKGRYANGSAAVKAYLAGGHLVVNLQSLEVKGTKVPEQVMTQLRTENLAKDAANNPKAREAMAKLESLEVKDGKIILTPRAGG